jgi:hypothetical protein
VRSRHLDAPFLINDFEENIAFPKVLDSVNLRIPSRSVRDYSTFSVHRNNKASPSLSCASARSAVCRNIDIINEVCIFLCVLVNLLPVFLYILFVSLLCILHFVLV